MASVRIETITPEKAAKYLQQNTHNRALSPKRVKALAGAIQRGEWRLTGDCVVFGNNGKGGFIENGQHRLYAIVEANEPVQLIVLYDAAPEAQEAMDSGMRRSLSDKLKLRGEKYSKELQAAIYLAFGMDNLGRPRAGTGATQPTHQQLLSYLEDNPELREACLMGDSLRKEFNSLPGSWVGWTFLFRRAVGDDLADSFLERLRVGAELSADDPIFILRRVLIRQKELPGDRRFGMEVLAATLVKAFNAYCLGQTPRILKYDSAREAFPAIISSDDLSG